MKIATFLTTVVTGLGLLTAAPLRAQPIVTSFIPTAGSQGDTVLIYGSGFDAGTSVMFSNGKLVSNPFVGSSTLITVTVPAGVANGPIGVSSDGIHWQYSGPRFTAIGPGPYITGMSPAYGAVGDPVMVSGAHFLNTTNVKFGSISVGSDYMPSADGTTLTTYVPSGAANGYITVATTLGTSNSPVPFTVIGPGPFISGFSPQAGNSSSSVSIEGRFFTGTTSVSFNGVTCSFSLTSDTLIMATPPATATTGPITVTTGTGNPFTTSSNFYAPPAITGFSSVKATVGTTVTVIGTSFTGTLGVYFNGTPQPTFSVNATGTQITVAVPDGATTGQILVSAPAGSAYSPASFVVSPSITGFSPAKGGVGTSVTITGSNLGSASSVTFNTAATTPSAKNYSSVSVTVPAGATSGYISVTTPDGTASSPSIFYLPPSISSFSPGTGGTGAAVAITGANFTNASAVTFAGAPAASFVVNSNSRITAYAPAGVISGPISVTTPGGTATSSGIFYGPPYISGFNPTHGLPGTQVTITGANFLGATQVQFNGLGVTPTSVANTQLVATVPTGAQTGPITVVTPGGTTNSTGLFTLDYVSDLQLSGTNAPNPAFVGSNLTYTLTVYNNSDLVTPNVWVTNTLPPGVVLNSWSTTSGSVITNNFPVILGNLGSVPNRSTVQLTLRVTAPLTAGTIDDVAQVTAGYIDPAPTNNSVTLTTLVLPLPLLSIQQTANTNQLRISWPVELTNFALQTVTPLRTNAPWTNVPAVPAISGTNRFIIETNRDPFRFYRLKS